MSQRQDFQFSTEHDLSLIKRDHVVSALRSAILRGDLRPGDRLVELRIAEQLGVSQTPVREALAAIEREGLIKKRRHLGTFVAELSHRELHELLTLRAQLEGYCARLCSQHMDSDGFQQLEEQIDRMLESERADDLETVLEADIAFHKILYVRSGHALLADVLYGLRQRMTLALAMVNATYSQEELGIAKSHSPVVVALKTRDPVAAERAARDHVLFVLEQVGGGPLDAPTLAPTSAATDQAETE